MSGEISSVSSKDEALASEFALSTLLAMKGSRALLFVLIRHPFLSLTSCTRI